MVIGGLVTVLAFGGVAGYDSAFGGNKIKSALGMNVGEKATAKKTSVIGEAPELSDLASNTPTPTPTPTPSPTKKSSTPTPTPTPSPKETNKAPVTPVVPAAADCISELPPKVLIAQKIVAPVNGDNLKEMTPIFNEAHVGGAILMTSLKDINDGSILAFKKAQSIAIEVSVDQEAGDVTNKTQKWPVARIQVPKSKLQPNGYMPTATEMAKMTPDKITAIVSENYKQL
jgi:hypothetical protein